MYRAIVFKSKRVGTSDVWFSMIFWSADATPGLMGLHPKLKYTSANLSFQSAIEHTYDVLRRLNDRVN